MVRATTNESTGIPVRRRHRRKFAEDPLVPIDGGRLRAAIDLRGYTISGLARDIGVKQQTLDYAVHRNQKCRQSLLTDVSRRLRVRELWLRGGSGGPARASRQTGENPNQPPAAQLAESWLLSQCKTAFRRDLKAFRPKLANARHDAESWSERRDAKERRRLEDRLLLAVSELVDPELWRERLIAWNDKFLVPARGQVLGGRGGPAMRSFRRIRTARMVARRPALPPEPTPDERDSIVPVLAKAFESILEPWLSGRARIAYGNLEDLVGLDLRAEQKLDEPGYRTHSPAHENVEPRTARRPHKSGRSGRPRQ